MIIKITDKCCHKYKLIEINASNLLKLTDGKSIKIAEPKENHKILIHPILFPYNDIHIEYIPT